MNRYLRRLTITATILLTALSLTTQAAIAAPAKTTQGTTQVDGPPRAMYVWSALPAEQVVAWASGHRVGELLVYVHPVLGPGELDRLRDLRRRADAAGIRLSALGGDPSWTFQPAAALAWQRTVVGTCLFTRLHVDIEPYALREWGTDRARTGRAFLDVLARLKAGSALPLEADVPFWYGAITVSGKNLATEVLRRVSAVTVMSYRDSVTGPNSVMAISADLLARAAVAGRPVRLAVETQPLADCPHCTFAEEGPVALAGALDLIEAAGMAQPAFAGTAVHHLDSWLALAA